jgi:hypothetical protein
MRQGRRFAGITIIFFLALFSQEAIGQIPNGGFENWVTDADTNFNPVGWETTNSYPLVSVDRVSPGFQGSFAMRVRTINAGFTLPGVAKLQTALPFGARPTQFTATFKSTLVGGDIGFIIIGLMKGDSVIASVDSCTFKVDSSFSQFTTRHFRIAYQSNLLPDSVVIIIASGLAFGHAGTELIVDDISFSGGGGTGVSEVAAIPRAFGLSQNFPNPFNPSTTIRYQIAAQGPVTLKVFDLLGRELTTLVDEFKGPGEHTVTWNASGAASGVYFYRLQSGSFVEAKRLLLLR